MNISIIGSGYVGLVSGACFAELGNHVICADNDTKKINSLSLGILALTNAKGPSTKKKLNWEEME